MNRRRPIRTALAAGLAALVAAAAVLVPAAPAAAITVNNFAQLAAEVTAGADDIVIGADFIEAVGSLAVDPGETVTIDLNGHNVIVTPAAALVPAFAVPPTATLTFVDTVGGGHFTARTFAGGTGAGIGGQPGGASGTVIIDGAQVTAGGGDGGAGIGGGAGGAGGTIDIVDGIVDGIGMNGGAGIGGGIGAPGGTITIEDGDVEASSIQDGPATDGGAGIGGGGGAAGTGGAITISGGTVVAHGLLGGAGIGGGYGAVGGTISLLGGSIDATSGNDGLTSGAAIGTGSGMMAPAPALSTLAGSPQPGAATGAGGGPSSYGVTYVPDGTAGIVYVATTADAVGAGDLAQSTVSFFHTVVFDEDGGSSVPGQNVAWGEPALEPADPTRGTDIFGGWHVGTAAGPLWDFSDTVTTGLTLVASWTVLPSITGVPSSGTVGLMYSYAMTVSGSGVITVSVFSGTLPPGLSVDSAGVISGIPTTVGMFNATLRATNGSQFDDQAVSISIAPGAPQAITFDPDGGTPDPADQVVGLGGTVVEPADPAKPGFAFNGWHVGTAAGPLYNFSTPVAGPLNLVAAWGAFPTITGAATAVATDGTAFSWLPTITALPVHSVGSTTLPAGLTINPVTGEISGIPTALVGDTLVTVTVTDANGSDSTDVTITVAHGPAVSFVVGASDLTPNQGDTITITVTASDAYGNSWDASAAATITSDVPTDVIVGNQVTFPHASPHQLQIVLPGIPAQFLLIQVQALALGLTGSEGAGVALPIALLAIALGAGLVVLRRRPVAGARRLT